jgi:phosphatidylserine/phosphatidylglycerophosphate/cardiolipin synthase-like enzyme
MGSNGVLPVTVVAPVPAICRHMANLIVRAEKEVFLATNFRIYSGASRIITDAILELLRRAVERRKRVIVKIMYDRGNIKQVVENHQIMSVKQYTAPAVQLPSPEEISNIDMEVQNFHRPMLGTFHSKFIVVDRKVAIVQSNNIQDNDNLEMMTHLEGEILNSVYNTALLAWFRVFDPPLPCLDSVTGRTNLETFHDPSFQALFDQDDKLRARHDSVHKEDLDGKHEQIPQPDRQSSSLDPDIGAEVGRMQTVLAPGDGETRMNTVTKHLSESIQSPLSYIRPLTSTGLSNEARPHRNRA